MGDDPLAYLETCTDISLAEKEIIRGYIKWRNAIKKTGNNTRKKQMYILAWIARALHDEGSTLDAFDIYDLMGVAEAANDGTQNTRQTRISILKAFSRYFHRYHHNIADLDLLDDVRGGGVEKNTKTALTLEQWHHILNLPMSAKHRAMLAFMYDGYHRPGEIFLLKWCDLVQSAAGVEYRIKFKTEKERTIVQKPGTTGILENWRRECGASENSEIYIFPTRGGGKHQTNIVLKRLFAQIREQTGLSWVVPSTIRATAITHDVEAGHTISYICLRAWGEPFNELINLYTKPDSAKIQRDAQKVTEGIATLGKSPEFTTGENELQTLKRRVSAMEDIMKDKLGM